MNSRVKYCGKLNMCGFIFEYRKKQVLFNKRKFLYASSYIKQRGPDENKFINYKNISTMFYRLSIRDLSKKGSQPMWDRSRRYLIVFNGEIYNSDDLKTKLGDIKLNGNSDTEVLVNMFAKFGLKTLNFLEGMFSFVIYDKILNTCTIARDRFGIKPLYFYDDYNKLILSSEIKPILKYVKNIDLNASAFADFFLKGNLDNNDKTFFNNIKSLEAGKYLLCQNNKIIKKNYWNLFSNINKDKDPLIIEKKVRQKIENSINKHLISDREVGLFLSGGTDSTSIAQIMSKKQKTKLKTFTYDFENNSNSETLKAKKIAKVLSAINYNIIVKPKHVINEIENLCKNLESPFTSIRLFGTYLLYKKADEKKIKVIIEGHGGDEMTAGYKYNYLPHLLDKNKINLNLSFNSIKKKLLEKENFKLDKTMFKTLNFQGLSTTDGTPNFFKNIFNKDFLKHNKFNYHIDKIVLDKINKKYGFLLKSQYEDIKDIKLPRVLKYSDRLSMMFGVESRVPFLDHDLFSYLFNLNSKMKFYNNQTRFIFKKSLKKERVSNFFTKQKNTIVDPQSAWLKKELLEFTLDNFNSAELRNSSIFNQKEVLIHYNNFLKGKIKTSFQIFNILTTINFFKAFKKVL